jgi:hypothetical protein
MLSSGEQALIIGECTTLLACAQAERIALIERLLGDPCVHIADTQGARGAELGSCRCKPAPLRDKLEATSLAAWELDRLERYQRRSLSRRKRAIENFMAINHMPAMRTAQTLPSATATPGIDEDATKLQFLAERTQIPQDRSRSPTKANIPMGLGYSTSW